MPSSESGPGFGTPPGEKTVISASRRTDIPALYGDWFINRVRAGGVKVRNPFNPAQVAEVSLRPEDVAAFVFWTKNPLPFFPHLSELEMSGHRFCFHFTITSVAGERFGRQVPPFEPEVPPRADSLEAFRQLCGRYSPDHVHWRFDPIVMSSVTPAEFHLERFEQLCAELRGFTRRCFFSFPVFYGKVRRAAGELLRSEGIQLFDIHPEEKTALASRLAETAASHGITLYSCCGDFPLDGRVRKAGCIGEDTLSAVTEADFSRSLRPTRRGCGCVASRDIGRYDTCTHGCVYCYANLDKGLARKHRQEHDPAGAFL